jgi:hypothetical protein
MDVNVQAPMLTEHARGDSLQTIGKRHGISHETARRVILQQGQSLITDLERDLRAGRRPAISIPYGQPLRGGQDALVMLQWSLTELRRHGWNVRVDSCPHETTGVQRERRIA